MAKLGDGMVTLEEAMRAVDRLNDAYPAAARASVGALCGVSAVCGGGRQFRHEMFCREAVRAHALSPAQAHFLGQMCDRPREFRAWLRQNN